MENEKAKEAENKEKVENKVSEIEKKVGSVEVETSVGKWQVVKPKAGVRNRAMAKAEVEDGFKKTVLMMELLPKCIGRRPDSFDAHVPIEQQLDGLETEDYDLLSRALGDLIAGPSEDVPEEKKK